MTRIQTTIIATLIMLACTLAGPVVAQTADNAKDVPHRMDLLEQSVSKDLQNFRYQLVGMNNRISDLHASAGWLGILMGGFAIVIGLGAAVSFVLSTQRAKNEVRKWAGEQKDDLLKELKMEAKACLTIFEVDAQAQIDEHVTKVKAEIEAIKQTATQYVAHLEQLCKNAEDRLQNGDGAKVSEDDKAALEKAAVAAAAKPTAERGYEDWRSLAIVASLEKEYPDSAYAYERAAFAADATQVQSASALFNRSWIIKRDGRMGDAIIAYDEMINRFGNFEAPEVREQVARARNGKADAQRNQAKGLWQDVDKAAEARELLTLSLAGFDPALDNGLGYGFMHAAGNKAYALFLLEADEDMVEALLRQALELGGKEQFNVVLEDIAICRLPQDGAYQALVKRVWAEVRAEQGDDTKDDA